jgi:hypothetical protein
MALKHLDSQASKGGAVCHTSQVCKSQVRLTQLPRARGDGKAASGGGGGVERREERWPAYAASSTYT